MENIKLQSGMNIIQNNSNDFEMDDKTLSIILLIIQKSFETASTYFNHSNRNGFSYDDILIGFKYEAHNFFDRPELDTDFPRMLKLINEMSQNEDDEYDEYDEYDEDDEGIDVVHNDRFEMNTCECELCKKCNLHASEWDDWKPDDPIQLLVKSIIDNNAFNFH